MLYAFILALTRQRQAELHEFRVNLIYIVSSRAARETVSTTTTITTTPTEEPKKQGPERWLSSEEHVLLLQRAHWVPSPSGGSRPSITSVLGTQCSYRVSIGTCTHVVHIHRDRPSYIHGHKINLRIQW